MQPPSPIMTLYHGTSRSSAEALVGGEPVNLERASQRADFGRGFYMTNCLEQAKAWAQRRYAWAPAVIQSEMEVHVFATLRSRAFAMAWPEDHNHFWAMVNWCRTGFDADEGHRGNEPLDVIVGPVAGMPLHQRVTLPGHDQVCFRTEAALGHINGKLTKVA